MNYQHLSESQRYEIKVYLNCNKSQKFIAEQLGVSQSCISRELNRNKLKRGGYSPEKAQDFTDVRKERFCYNRRFTKTVKDFVDQKLTQEQWSLEQIVGYCNKHKIEMVSIERIYQYLRADKKNGGKLYLQLRHQLKHRNRPISGKHEIIKNKKSIETRPEIVLTNQEFGHYEIDLIIGAEGKGAILTLVERKTKFLFMEKLKGKNAKELAKSMVNILIPYKNSIKTITSNNGTEFAENQYISKKFHCDFYFAHAYSSWEIGLNENTNGLIRQYIPKGTYFEKVSKENIKEYQHKINRRPRLTLDFEEPKNLFFKFVNQIALAS
jgi:IS30 family transposase